MKTCTSCHISKDLSQFYAYKTGVWAWCKDCARAKARKYAATPTGKLTQHRYYLRNRDRYIEKATARSKIYGTTRNKNDRFYARRLAEFAVRAAIKRGEIVRPAYCEHCFKECTPQAHHYLGYEEEHRLSVKFLCSYCHGVEHRSRSKQHKGAANLETAPDQPPLS